MRVVLWSPSSPDVGYLQFADEVLWKELLSTGLTTGGVRHNEHYGVETARRLGPAVAREESDGVGGEGGVWGTEARKERERLGEEYTHGDVGGNA